MSDETLKTVEVKISSDIDADDGDIIIQFKLSADALADVMIAVSDERRMMLGHDYPPFSATADKLGSELITEAGLRAYEAGLGVPQKVKDWLLTYEMERELSKENDSE